MCALQVHLCFTYLICVIGRKFGEVTSFPKAVQLKENEVVVFSWAVWPSKEVRDEGWKKVMEDPRMDPKENPMPFDGKRLIYGGFATVVKA